MVVVVQARPCPVTSLCFVYAIAHHSIHINMRAFSFHFFILNQPTHWTDHSLSHLFFTFLSNLSPFVAHTLTYPIHCSLCSIPFLLLCPSSPFFNSIFFYLFSFHRPSPTFSLHLSSFPSFLLFHTYSLAHSHTPTVEFPSLSFSFSIRLSPLPRPSPSPFSVDHPPIPSRL